MWQDQPHSVGLRTQHQGIMNSAESRRSSSLNALKCELASEVLLSSGELRLQVTGWSMLPAVWPGDVVLIEPVKSDSIAAGDIVMFRRGDRFIAHRVVTPSTDGKKSIITQGDSLPAPDPPVSGGEFLGKVMLIERNGRCIEPGPHLSFPARAFAAVIRRSESAARIVVGVHGMRQPPQE